MINLKLNKKTVKRQKNINPINSISNRRKKITSKIKKYIGGVTPNQNPEEETKETKEEEAETKKKEEEAEIKKKEEEAETKKKRRKNTTIKKSKKKKKRI